MKRRTLSVFCILLFCLAFAGCGKKSEADKESTEVMQLTITPQPSPTPLPRDVYPEAVVSKNGTTMVNKFLLDKAGEKME